MAAELDTNETPAQRRRRERALASVNAEDGAAEEETQTEGAAEDPIDALLQTAPEIPQTPPDAPEAVQVTITEAQAPEAPPVSQRLLAEQAAGRAALARRAARP